LEKNGLDAFAIFGDLRSLPQLAPRKESAMAHQDQGRKDSPCSHARDLHTALKWLWMGVGLSGIAMRPDCSWTPQTLAFAGLLWAWSDEKTLGERFAIARKIIIDRFEEQQEPAGSYQAFIKLLRKWTEPLKMALGTAFRQRMPELLAEVWKVAGWVVFAADGSRVDVPRTRKNEERYSPKSKLSREAQKRRRQTRRRRTRKAARQRKANVPRIWMTVLWHVGSGLPFDWRTGPSDSSERGHLEEMLGTMPAGSLVTADAGFVGYEFWKSILDAGHQLLVRVGSNVTLLKGLGYARERDDVVYLWPDRAAKKRLPPLVLRLVVVTTGKHPIYLATSVMDRRRLSDRQVAEVYRRRWGIEVYYRHCKQTFERRKLRSQNPDNAMVELHWSLLGMWAMGLHSHHRLVQKGIPPERISFANVWRAYRRPMREYKSCPDRGERLTEWLDRAIIDSYERKNKTSRDYPRKKEEKAAGPPVIREATPMQVALAEQIKLQQKKGLTA
jgi:IS4 transposase